MADRRQRVTKVGTRYRIHIPNKIVEYLGIKDNDYYRFDLAPNARDMLLVKCYPKKKNET